MSVIRKLDRDPVVAFHVAYAKLPGSDPVCALFLSQVSYWCSRSEDGVAWITHQAMYDQTGMSRKQQDRAASYWESVGVMTKFIKGIPPKIHYSIDYARLEAFILEEPVGQVDMSERDILDVQNGQYVMSERDKTSSRDSKDSQRLSVDLNADATKQQPESALTISALAPTPRSRKQPRSAKPTIPNVADFLAWAGETHPEWVREAEAWYKRMESQDWVKVNGERVMNAKGTFNTWLANGWIKRIVGSSTGWAKL